MAVINAFSRFHMRRKKSLPIAKIPVNVREAFHIETMYKNGIAKLEPGKKNCLYDRCYVFEEINYINKDEGEKVSFLNQFMVWLKSINMDFKITIANEYQSMDEFLQKVRDVPNEGSYPRIGEGMDLWIQKKMEDSNPNVTTLRYLTISTRASSMEDARVAFNSMDTVIQSMFSAWGARNIVLTAEERLKCIHSLLRPGKKDEETYLSLMKGRNWKNDVLPHSIRTFSNYMQLDDTCMSVLFGWKYQGSINPDHFIRTFSNTEYPSFLTMDFGPVSASEISDFLTAAGINVEKAISDEEEARRRRNIIGTGPSYARQRKKDEVEGLQDLVAENDETGFFMNLLMVVTAPDVETLDQRVSEICASAKPEGVIMETANWQQLKALNTALPFGGRHVDYMRFFLSSSVAAFQPFYAQDIIEPGGYMYGLNRTTKRLILGNRKLLMNPHGIIIGHTGSGKSLLIKLTEILQTLIGTDDDILILDPQNEFRDIVREFGGVFFDLTPKSGIHLNGFEVYEDVFYGDEETKERFVAAQTKYARSLLAAVMKNITFTQEHASVVGRCCRRMYDKIFAQSKLRKQPTLKLLRKEIRAELDGAKSEYDQNIIRPIYNSLEEYTEGACDMLSRPSNVRFDERLVGFGLKNVPEDNWEAVMLTVMHYTSSRMEYNQKERRAVHFIVDETQVLSRKGTSADQLNTAVATFRKFGGICTMAMQNLTAALHNEQLKELFSNCSYKCFLDQGGVDANALAEIQELSKTEFDALSTDEPGIGVMVWGKKVVLFDAKVAKDNPLYGLISTDFHGKEIREKDAWRKASPREEPAREEAGLLSEEERPSPKKEYDPVRKKKRGEIRRKRKAGEPGPMTEENEEIRTMERRDRASQIILQMASYQDVDMKDILCILEDLPEDKIREKISSLTDEGRLTVIEGPYGIRYRKGR
ncbi:MAG: DUF87 domain-containing protein [Eubacterium sp.]|nr:DUF87 domain-containing protein [Eubacterium sp.]